jgi:dolichyl-phosphate-mannose--protein O-mannosyl transferase
VWIKILVVLAFCNHNCCVLYPVRIVVLPLDEDQKDRERELVNAEMIPLRATTLSFWEKFIELQYKMLFASQENVQNHMYSSEPVEWPFMARGIAYWVSPHSNVSTFPPAS